MTYRGCRLARHLLSNSVVGKRPRSTSITGQFSQSWLGELTNLKNKFLLLVILGVVLPAAAGNRKVANDLPQSGNGPVDVIIQFTTPPTQRHYAKVSQHGGTVKHELSVVNGLHASMTPAQLNELAA